MDRAEMRKRVNRLKEQAPRPVEAPASSVSPTPPSPPPLSVPPPTTPSPPTPTPAPPPPPPHGDSPAPRRPRIRAMRGDASPPAAKAAAPDAFELVPPRVESRHGSLSSGRNGVHRTLAPANGYSRLDDALGDEEAGLARGAPATAPAEAVLAPKPHPDYGPSAGTIRQRCRLRVIWWCLTIGTVWVLIALVRMPLLEVDADRTFDPSRKLNVEVSGCDVHILPAEPGSAARVRLQGMLSRTRAEWLASSDRFGARSDDGTGSVYYLRAWSSADCRRLPFMQCAESCLVTLSIPHGVVPAELHVSQAETDESPWLQLRARDVELGTLRVRGNAGQFWDVTGPTLDVGLQRVAIRDALLVSLSGGSMRCDECDIAPGATVDVRTRAGSIAMDALWPAAERAPSAGGEQTYVPAVQMHLHQPMNYMCVAAETPAGGQRAGAPLVNRSGGAAEAGAAEPAAGAPSAGGAWADAFETEIVPDSDPWESCSSDWHMGGTFELFDKNRDAFVDRAEFLRALDSIPYCCGAEDCPHASDCEPVSWKVFPALSAPLPAPSGAGLSGQFGLLSVSAFMRSLMRYNLSGLVPNCFDRVVVEAVPLDPDARAARSVARGAGPGGADGGAAAGGLRRRRHGAGTRVNVGIGVGGATVRGRASLRRMLRERRRRWHDARADERGGSDADGGGGGGGDGSGTGAGDALRRPLGAGAADAIGCAAAGGDGCEPHYPAPSARAPPTPPPSPSPSEPPMAPPPPPAPPPQPPAPPLAPAVWAGLEALGGQIHVSVRARHSHWRASERGSASSGLYGGGSSSAWPPHTASDGARFYAPPDRYAGIRMLAADARHLSAEVGAQYGDLSSSSHAFVVFDVPAAPGIPRSLWVYATAPIFHVLEPATLAHLSLGTLVPTLLRYRVRFHSTGCEANLTLGAERQGSCGALYMPAGQSTAALDAVCSEAEYPDQTARLAQVYDGLVRAIKSDALDTRRLRGQVLLVGPPSHDSSYWWLNEPGSNQHSLYEFSYSTQTGEHTVVPLRASRLSALIHLAVLLSVFASLIVAGCGAHGVYIGAHAILHRAASAQRSKLRMLSAKGLPLEEFSGASGEEGAAERRLGGGGGGGGGGIDGISAGRAVLRGAPDLAVLRAPLSFISVVFIAPLRRRFTPSLTRFVDDACELDEILHFGGKEIVVRRRAKPRRAAAPKRAPSTIKRPPLEAGPAAAPAGAAEPSPAAADERAAAAAAADGGPGRSVVLMSQLVGAYELYCFQHDLEILGSHVAVARALISEFNCRVCAATATHYFGLAWRAVAPTPAPAAPLRAGRVSERELVRAFVRERCVLASPSARRALAADGGGGDGGSGALRDAAAEPAEAAAALAPVAPRGCFVTAEPVAGLSSQPGFVPELRAWCEARGVPAPSDAARVAVLAELGVGVSEAVVRTVHGVRLRETPRPRSLTCGRFVMEGLTVLAHFWLLVLPGLAVLSTSVYAQEVFIRTDATRQPLLWQHAFERTKEGGLLWLQSLLNSGRRQVVATVRFEILEQILFVCFTLVHMLLHYLGRPRARGLLAWCARTLDSLYGLLLGAHVVLLLFHVTLNLTWCLLAAILDPHHFLPAGTAVVVGVAVVITTQRDLVAAAAVLRQRLSAAFHSLLHDALRTARRHHEPGAEPLPSAAAAEPSSEEQRTVRAADVFSLLTAESDSLTLEFDSFVELFSQLDVNLSEARKEQLFAFMDSTGDGHIDQKEFEDGWDFLVEQMIEEAAESMGLSGARIVLALLATVMWLVSMFAFIFLAVQGWFTQGSFASTVQSIFICTSGVMVKMIRSRSVSEQSERVDELVRAITDRVDAAGDSSRQR